MRQSKGAFEVRLKQMWCRRGVALTCPPPWNRALTTNTPLSPGALPAATAVGKPPSACAKRSSEIAWNINPILLREENGRDPCPRAPPSPGRPTGAQRRPPRGRFLGGSHDHTKFKPC